MITMTLVVKETITGITIDTSYTDSNKSKRENIVMTKIHYLVKNFTDEMKEELNRKEDE